MEVPARGLKCRDGTGIKKQSRNGSPRKEFQTRRRMKFLPRKGLKCRDGTGIKTELESKRNWNQNGTGIRRCRMRELIRFEIGKILNRPIAKLALAGMAVFTAAMLCIFVFPFSIVVQEEIDGEIVVTRGFDAVKRNKEIVAAYEGPLTAEKVQDILETYSFSEAVMEREGLPEQRYFTHNYLYDCMMLYFGESDGSFKGKNHYDSFMRYCPVQEDNYILGYSRGWEEAICGLRVCFIVWVCVLAVLISPVFAEEYTRRMDALILPGKNGRSKCPAAKIISAYTVAMGGSLLMIAAFLVGLWCVHGFTGYQASTFGMTFFVSVVYPLCWWQAFALSVLLWLTAVLVLTSLIMIVSALSKGAFAALAASFAVLLVPHLLLEFVYNHHMLMRHLLILMPFEQVRLMDVFLQQTLTVCGRKVEVVWLCLPVCAVITPLGIFLSKHFFSRHRVA